MVNTKKNTPNPDAAVDPTLEGKLDVNTSPREAAFQDLYLGEEEATRTSIDASRLQKLIVTILVVYRPQWISTFDDSIYLAKK